MNVRVDDEREHDGVRWGVAAALGFGFLVVGMGLGQLSLDRSPGEVASARAAEADALGARVEAPQDTKSDSAPAAANMAAEAAEPAAPSRQQPAPTPPTTPAVVAEPVNGNDGPAAVEPPEVEAAPSGLARPSAVRVGRVAYLRCEGAETDDPRIPCPRDHGLEARAWRAIRALRECNVGSGAGDVRFTFEFGALTATRFRERSGSEMSIPQATQCIAPAADGMQTEINARRLIVSFRFELTR